VTRHTNRQGRIAARGAGGVGRRSEAIPIDATRVLEVGSVLRRAFLAWRSDAGKFAAVFVVVNVPILLIGAWTYSSPWNWMARAGTYGLAVGFGSWFLEAIAVGATVHGTIQRLAGGSVSLRKCLSTAGSRFVSLVGIACRIGAIVFGIGLLVLFALAIPLYASGSMKPSSPNFNVGMWVTTGCAFVVPLLIVTLRYWIAAPVCVAEQKSSGDSMRRARALQRGNRWPVLWVAVILWGLRLSIGYGVTLALGGESPSAVAGHSERILAAFEAARRVALIYQGLDLLFFSPLFAVAATVAYHDLRRGKEGVETAELVRVFE
jgi:hypothetical protein